jgi:hypothetical protein
MVGVAGFEPAASSSRIKRTSRPSRCYTTFLQLKGSDTATITASDRTCQRAAAPILLPELDMTYRVAATIVICPAAAIGRVTGARYAGEHGGKRGKLSTASSRRPGATGIAGWLAR